MTTYDDWKTRDDNEPGDGSDLWCDDCRGYVCQCEEISEDAEAEDRASGEGMNAG